MRFMPVGMRALAIIIVAYTSGSLEMGFTRYMDVRQSKRIQDSFMPGRRLVLRGAGVCAPDDIGAPGYYQPLPEGEIWEFIRRKYMQPTQEKDLSQEAPTLISVPGSHADIGSAIAELQNKTETELQKRTEIMIKAGDHRWEGFLDLPWDRNVTLDVKGEAGTRLLGRWGLSACWDLQDVGSDAVVSRGSFSGVTCAYATDKYTLEPAEDRDRQRPEAIITALGGPWSFIKCELRAAGADVLVCLSRSQVSASHCSAGGMGVAWEHNGTMAACTAVHCSDTSTCTLVSTTLEMCGNWGGSAARGVGACRMVLQKCSILSSVLGLVVDDAAMVQADSCLWKDNQFAHLHSLENATMTAVKLTNNNFLEGDGDMQGQQWLTEARPGHLEEEGTQIEGKAKSENEIDDMLNDEEEIPEENFETHPELLRLDYLHEFIQRLRQMQDDPAENEEGEDDEEQPPRVQNRGVRQIARPQRR